MSGNLHQAGVRFLRLLGRHAEPIMDAYLAGSVADQALEPAVEERLVKEGILYRPEPGADLHLRRAVRALLEEALRDDRNRQIDANTGSALATFKTLAAHYKERAIRATTRPPTPTWASCASTSTPSARRWATASACCGAGSTTSSAMSAPSMPRSARTSWPSPR
ncbi:hypothetical protein ACE0DR_09805 [Azotobacter sp. CWF10]